MKAMEVTASRSEMKGTVKMSDRYCWSFNEEEFHGGEESREHALDAAIDAAADEPEYIKMVWTGRIMTPAEMVKPHIHVLTETLVDRLNDEVGERCGSYSCIEYKAGFIKSLASIISEKIVSGTTFNRFAVDDIQRHDIRKEE